MVTVMGIKMISAGTGMGVKIATWKWAGIGIKNHSCRHLVSLREYIIYWLHICGSCVLVTFRYRFIVESMITLELFGVV